MNLPPNMTEEEVLAIIDNIANRLSAKFKFGYHSIDDMRQQARMFALEGMSNYDNVRPLENFLWTHVRNRLYNFKRNNFGRPDNPCDACPFFVPSFQNARNYPCKAFDNENDCDLYVGWLKRNTSKKNIMNTLQLDIDLKELKSVDDTLDAKHIFEIIDKHLPVNYREDWIRLTNNLKLPKGRREIVTEVILDLLEKHGITEETWHDE